MISRFIGLSRVCGTTTTARVLLNSNYQQKLNFSLTVNKMVKFINQMEAISIDTELFDSFKFSVDQLMELAGLSCANAIADCYNRDRMKNILVICGPGNNGGDGLVCARHLKHFCYEPTILYPKQKDVPLYLNLAHQCKSLDIEIKKTGIDLLTMDCSYDLIVDAVFGFSFKPPVNETFEPIILALNHTKTPIISIDIPSGWHVEKGPPPGSFQPEMLISLTAPKMCANCFTGKYHYLGGRFVPFDLAKKYDLQLPDYPGTQNFIRLK